MDNNSDEDIPNAHPEIQVVEQGDASEATSSSHLLNRSQLK